MIEKKTIFSFIATILAVLAAAVPQAVSAEMDATQELMRARVEEIHLGMGLEIDAVPVAARHLIPLLYERRDFAPLWLDPSKRDELISLIRDSAKEGLDPDDYHAGVIEDYQNRSDDAETFRFVVDRDIIFSDSLVRLGYHLFFGIQPRSGAIRPATVRPAAPASSRRRE